MIYLKGFKRAREEYGLYLKSADIYWRIIKWNYEVSRAPKSQLGIYTQRDRLMGTLIKPVWSDGLLNHLGIYLSPLRREVELNALQDIEQQMVQLRTRARKARRKAIEKTRR